MNTESSHMVERIPKLERLMNLLSALLAAGEPLPFREIAGRVIGYDDPVGMDALEKRFERDKSDLRTLGLPVEYVPASAQERAGYRIPTDRVFLQEVRLTPEESVLLSIAGRVGTHATGGGPLEGALKSALRKLAVDLPLPDAMADTEGLTVLRARQADPAVRERLAALAEAVTRNHRVRITYHALGSSEPTAREVEPYGLGMAHGAWYLVGHCHRRGMVRVFKLLRIVGSVETLARPDAPPDFVVPEDFDIDRHLGLEVWEMGETEPVRAQLRAAPGVFPDDEQGQPVLERELEVRQPDALVSWVLAQGGQAVVEGPDGLNDRVRGVARELLERYRAEPQLGPEAPAEAGAATSAAGAQQGSQA